jgi:hypothetical protein
LMESVQRTDSLQIGVGSNRLQPTCRLGCIM